MHESQTTCDALQKKMDEIKATYDLRHEKNNELEKHCANVTTELDPMVAQDIEIITPNEYTPLKRTEHFLNENFNDVKTPQKEVIKKTVLEHNVLRDSLKEKIATSSNQTKSTLKEIIDSKTVRKYKQV